MSINDDPKKAVRLNRYIAEAGLCSRRDAMDLIADEKVTVNGKTIKDPAFQVGREKDAVKVDGKRIFLQPLVYILLNKPEGVVSTVDDPEKRPTVVSMLRGVKARVYPVGRLDYNTSGVLLLTNDGELALKLSHPRYGFEKTYQVKVNGVPKPAIIQKLASGVRIPNWKGDYEKTLPAKVRMLKKIGKHAVLEMTLREGKQHQVKKMCKAVGHMVEKLSRVKFGFLKVSGLMVGQWRYLTSDEIHKLQTFKPTLSKEGGRPTGHTGKRPLKEFAGGKGRVKSKKNTKSGNLSRQGKKDKRSATGNGRGISSPGVQGNEKSQRVRGIKGSARKKR